MSGGSAQHGANIQQWTDNGTNAQKFEVTFNKDDSTYVITNVISNMALDVADWSTANGGNVLVWDNNNTANQRWYITFIDGGYVFFINKHSNKALDVSGVSAASGANVHQWDYVAGANQQWKFVAVN